MRCDKAKKTTGKKDKQTKEKEKGVSDGTRDRKRTR